MKKILVLSTLLVITLLSLSVLDKKIYAASDNPPVISSIPGERISVGGTYQSDSHFHAAATFTDPDSTSWTATVDYGDGSGTQSLGAVLQNDFINMNHTYNTQGSYTVTVAVTDDAGWTGEQTTTVLVGNICSVCPAGTALAGSPASYGTHEPGQVCGALMQDDVNAVYCDHSGNTCTSPVSVEPFCSSPTVTPSPTPQISGSINVSLSSANETVNTPFNVDVIVNGGGTAFNAAQATVAVSSNLTIVGLQNPTTNPCNFNYTKSPSTTDPSFAGAIYTSSTTNCKVYTLTLMPNSEGVGTITFTNAAIKSYANNSEILSSVQNGSYTIGTITPTPTNGPSSFTITPVEDTYASSATLTGTKSDTLTQIFVNGSSANSTYPTNTSWSNTQSLVLGANTFVVYGSDASNNQTATQSITVNRHTLGDINGDGVIDLTDASLFSVDWGKTSNLTYPLSDMNGDGVVDLTDLSILAKLIQ